MLKRLFTFILCSCLIYSFAQTNETGRVIVNGEIKESNFEPVSYAHILLKTRNEGCVGDYYGKFTIGVFPGDTLIISAVSLHHEIIFIPDTISSAEYFVQVFMQKDTVNLKELVVRPWPATFKLLKEEFMKIEIEDPIADLDLHLPTPEEMRNLAYSQGGIVIPGPIGILYDQFSKEARSKKIYAELMKKENAGKRYNKTMVKRITGLKNDDDIRKFMEFCALQIRFILESTDYELYAAIMNCFGEFCKINDGTTAPGE